MVEYPTWNILFVSKTRHTHPPGSKRMSKINDLTNYISTKLNFHKNHTKKLLSSSDPSYKLDWNFLTSWGLEKSKGKKNKQKRFFTFFLFFFPDTFRWESFKNYTTLASTRRTQWHTYEVEMDPLTEHSQVWFPTISISIIMYLIRLLPLTILM